MSVRSKLRLLAKLRNKEYRDAYVEEHVKTSLPYQIRALRDQRGWTQGRLANEANTTQTAISRVENPEYGNLSLNTLYKLASAFDVALLVKFVPFSRLLDEFEDVSPEALEVPSFDEEIDSLEEAATAIAWTVDVPAQVYSYRVAAPPGLVHRPITWGETFWEAAFSVEQQVNVWSPFTSLQGVGRIPTEGVAAKLPATTQDLIADSVM